MTVAYSADPSSYLNVRVKSSSLTSLSSRCREGPRRAMEAHASGCSQISARSHLRAPTLTSLGGGNMVGARKGITTAVRHAV